MIAIAAVDDNFAIGRDNSLLYRLSADMKRFRALTSGGAVIMGRKTFESIGKPLPNRLNIVLSRDLAFELAGALVCHSPQEAAAAAHDAGIADDRVFVIGGESIYKLLFPQTDKVLLTHIYDAATEPDAFFPSLERAEWVLVGAEGHTDEATGLRYAFKEYVRQRVQIL